MKVGYARTSTTDQIAGLEAQARDLKQAGCKKIFAEQVSSVAERAQLTAALDFIREGDTLVVTKLDRLARSIGHLSEITKALEAKKADLQVLAMASNQRGAHSAVLGAELRARVYLDRNHPTFNPTARHLGLGWGARGPGRGSSGVHIKEA